MTSPDPPPPKKLLKDEHVEGIDLSDFDGEAQKVAGIDLGEAPKKPAPAQAPPPPQRPMRATMDLPEGEASALSGSAHRTAGPLGAPARAAPAAETAGPVISPAQGPESSPLAPSGAGRAKAVPKPPVLYFEAEPAPAAVPEPQVPEPSLEPVAEAAPDFAWSRPSATPAPKAPAPRPSPEQKPPAGIEPPQVPEPAPAPVVEARRPVPTAAPTPAAAPAPYAPAPYPSPYGYPQAQYPAPHGGYPPYGAPAPYGAYPYTGYAAPLPPRVPPSPTVEGLSRLRIAAGIAIVYFALAALHRTYSALTGATDIPGGAQGVSSGIQFLSYFLWACEAAAAAIAVAACASGLLRVRESKSEARIPAHAPSRKPLTLLSLALAVPIATGVATWIHMGSVQRSLPGLGTTSDLGLALLFDEYRATTFALGLAGIAAAFLIVLGLRAGLMHLSPLVARREFRQFAWLFVLGSAGVAALHLVLLHTVLQAPMAGTRAVSHPELLLLIAGPALSCTAFWRLRSYLGGLQSEAERRHAVKPGA